MAIMAQHFVSPAILAVLPTCCDCFDMALAAPTYQRAAPEPMYLDPVVLVVTFLFLVQASVFFWLGSCWGHRGQRALELRLKVTGDKLRLVEINSERLKRM